MKLYVATHNQHKVREMSQILPGFEIVPDDPEGVEENAPDFVGNALVKVRAIAARHPGAWCMADDSGLEVKALGGAPGVRSARYAGEPCSTPANNALLLKNLKGIEDRTANFTCAVALVDPEGRERTVVGKCFGRIAESPSGAEGFGYDPLFVPDGYDRSFAELTAEEKNAISHRGKALEKVLECIGKRRETGDAGRDGVSRLSSDVSRRENRPCNPWLRLFRVVNLPTVPGDVLVGAAAMLAACWHVSAAGGQASSPPLAPVWWAALASVFMYMFGLADNDIVGAKTDIGRPIPDGGISLGAARVARAICIAAVMAIGVFTGLSRLPTWSVPAFLLVCSVVAYNRLKRPLLMGLARGLNVACGGLFLVSPVTLGLAALWVAYIAFVTKYSEGEEGDPAKKRRVGALVGGIVYLQLAALIALTLAFPGVAAMRPLLLAGAGMLALLRFFRAFLPSVSAS